MRAFRDVALAVRIRDVVITMCGIVRGDVGHGRLGCQGYAGIGKSDGGVNGRRVMK